MRRRAHHGRSARCRAPSGPGWGVRARIERFVEPSLLLLLRERPAHGYELVAGLQELVPGERVDMPGLYRILRALEGEGLVRSRWEADAPGPARRTYELTTEGRIANRHSRLYLDIGRNGYAQTMAAPYAVRALPGAPVSVPLDWSELDDWVPGQDTLRNIADRLAAPDPWAGMDAAASRLKEA